MTTHICASHILVTFAGSAESTSTRTKGEARDEIERLREAVKGGADFSDLARQHSDCPSCEDGGELGEFSQGEMVPEFERAAFALPLHGVSDVIETAFGFHIIQRTG